jgi:hypothetical protein
MDQGGAAMKARSDLRELRYGNLDAEQRAFVSACRARGSDVRFYETVPEGDILYLVFRGTTDPAIFNAILDGLMESYYSGELAFRYEQQAVLQ